MATDRAKITEARIEALKKKAAPSASGLFLWDTELPGFGVRASAAKTYKQKVSYLVQRYRGGKLERAVLGHYPARSIDEARQEAHRRLADDTRSLKAWNDEKRQKAQEEAAADTLQSAVNRYLQANAKETRYWREVRQAFNRDIIPKLGKATPLRSISRRQLLELLDARAGQPAMARYLYLVLHAFFRWCASREYIDKSPFEGMAKRDRPQGVPKRKRILSDDEIRTLWEATEPLPKDEKLHPLSDPKDNELWNPFHRLLLLTAQRREEVGAMRWDELDLEKATWTIPGERTKNGEEHLVHLSPQAVEVLATVPRLEKCPYVFSGNGETSVKGYSKAKARLDKRMGEVPAWRIHDLRRTAASGMDGLGFRTIVIEYILNHISGTRGGLTGTYQRHPNLEERKRAIEAWGNYVEQLVSDRQPEANVISFGSLS